MFHGSCRPAVRPGLAGPPSGLGCLRLCVSGTDNYCVNDKLLLRLCSALFSCYFNIQHSSFNIHHSPLTPESLKGPRSFHAISTFNIHHSSFIVPPLTPESPEWFQALFIQWQHSSFIKIILILHERSILVNQKIPCCIYPASSLHFLFLFCC